MKGTNLSEAAKLLINKGVKSFKRMDNTLFFPLENIGDAFGHTDVDVAVIFSDIPHEIDTDYFEKSFVELCMYLQQLKDKGGEFAFDVSGNKLGPVWGIAYPAPCNVCQGKSP